MGDDEEYIEKLLKNTSPDKYWRLPLDSTMKKKVE
jgi:hypothetical protein